MTKNDIRANWVAGKYAKAPQNWAIETIKFKFGDN